MITLLRSLTSLCLLSIVVATGCGGAKIATTGPAKVEIPFSDGAVKAKRAGPPARQAAPPSGATKQSPFPTVARSKLSNGMGVDVVTAHALPIVQVRLLVRAGSGYGSEPAVGSIAASMLKDGGTRSMSSAEVLRRVETLGSDLSVRSEPDATVLSLALTKDRVSEGLGLLSQIAREPRFDEGELKKLKARTVDESEDQARSSGSWTATWLVFHELFEGNAKHPYASYGLLPSQIAKVDGAMVRDFHKKFFVPKAATLVIAGDIEEATAKELAQKHFGAWSGGEPPKVDLAPPKAPEKTRVYIAHRPKSVQSDVFVGMLAPARNDPHWAHVRVTNQVLGGGVASRLFSDVREQRSLAYRTNASILELAHGQQPLVLYAGTESSKTSQAVAGLLENLERMKSAPPTQVEVSIARVYLSDIFAIRMETIGSIAEMVVTQETFGLADGYWDEYRKLVRATDPKDTNEMGQKLYASKQLIVVAGDADVIGGELSKLGEVTVVDPEKEFKTIKTIPAAGK